MTPSPGCSHVFQKEIGKKLGHSVQQELESRMLCVRLHTGDALLFLQIRTVPQRSPRE